MVTGIWRAFTAGDLGAEYIALFDGSNFHVYRVNLENGQTVRVSSVGFADPRGLSRDAAGTLIVSERGFAGSQPSISRIGAVSGAVTSLSSDGQFMSPWGVTLEMNGTIVMADSQNLFSCSPAGRPPTCPGALFRIDPLPGTQMLVTEKDLFHAIAGVDIYRGPSTTAVPPSGPTLALSLQSPDPNPTSGPLTITFTLPDAALAQLGVFDLSGRALETREVGQLGPGTHSVTLSGGGEHRAGLLWIRLRRADRVLTRTTIFLR